MGDVSGYPNGTFCWIDLATPDVAEAAEFYGKLLGWEWEDRSAGGPRRYLAARLHGKDVAAIHEDRDARVEWGSSVSVDAVDEITSRAEELGADTLAEPHDVRDAGRMSKVRDPAGAVVGLWQAKGHPGAGFVNDVNAWSWNELVTPAVDEATRFYGELFGWQAEDVPAPMRRASFSLGNLLIGGVHAPTPAEGDASRWTVSFTVADADAAAGTVEELGGQVLLSPMDIAIGRFAIVSDPAGASFTLAAVPGGAFRGVDGS